MGRLDRVRELMLAGAALAAAQAAPLWAQDHDAVPADQGSGESIKTTKTDSGDIVVTARHFVPDAGQTANKTDIPLIQTPQSVSVITRDQIDLLSFVDLQQAVRYTAGVGGENYGSDPRYDFVTVRGFTPKQFIDGLAVPKTTTFDSIGVDLYLFQSVDILKGPASALYGSAPPGGILNEDLRRPSATAGGELIVKGGTNDFREIAGTITGASTPFLDVRMTGLYRDTSLDVHHTNDKRVAVAPSATLKLGPDTKLTGLLYYQYDRDRGGAGGFVPANGSLLPNPNGRISRSTNLDDPNDLFLRRQYGAGYEFDQRIGAHLRVVSNTKWSHYHEDTPIGLYDSGGFVLDPVTFLPVDNRTISQSNYTFGEKVASFATDNRLDIDVATGAIKHKALIGIDYRNLRTDANYGFAFGIRTLDVFDPVYTPVAEFPESTRYNQQKIKQTGAYAQDQINYDRLYLMLSGRYDWVRSRSAAPFTPASAPPIYSGQKDHKFTYHVGLTYVSDAGIAPYVSYATSFEPVIGDDTTTMNPLKPTNTKQIEGGIKFDARGLPSDVKLFATVAGFDIKQRDFVSTQVGQGPTTATQGGEVEVYGGEFELVARFRQQLTLNVAVSYNHSKITKASPAEPNDLGYPLPTTPKYKATTFADYIFRNGVLAGFGFGGGVRYTSKQTGALPGAFGSPVIFGDPSTLFDAQVHYDLPGWRFSVNGSNITDKRYVGRCSNYSQCFFGPGRQILATITKRF